MPGKPGARKPTAATPPSPTPAAGAPVSPPGQSDGTTPPPPAIAATPGAPPGASEAKPGDLPTNGKPSTAPKTATAIGLPKTSPGSVEVTHTGMVRILRRKRKTIHLIIGVAVLISLVPVFFLARWIKYAMTRSGQPPPKRQQHQPLSQQPPPVVQWSPYEDEFRALSAKTKGMPRTRAEVDERIKAWQGFIAALPADVDPEDFIVKRAKEHLRSLESLREMYPQ